MVIRLAIRPRLVLTPKRVPARRRVQWPPLALPAAGYWLAMGGLTYAFIQLGPHPLDESEASAPRHRVDISGPPESGRQLDPRPGSRTTTPGAPAEHESEPAMPAASEVLSRAELTADGNATRPGEAAMESAARLRRSRRSARGDAVAGGVSEARVTPDTSPLAFPGFTDGSRPWQPEHAADGPRIESLFEHTIERLDSTPPLPPPSEREPDAAVTATSCEAAMAHNNEQISFGGPRGAADISREAYASILQNGRYLSACSIPARTVLEVCAAVKEGHTVGITVVSSPQNPGLNACVKVAVARLKFPNSPRLDITHTRFDAVPR